jgi:hypothetical protein
VLRGGVGVGVGGGGDAGIGLVVGPPGTCGGAVGCGPGVRVCPVNGGGVFPGGEGAATVDWVGSGWNVTVASVFDEGFAGDNGANAGGAEAGGGAQAGGAEAGGGAEVGTGTGGATTVDWVGASWEVTDT